MSISLSTNYGGLSLHSPVVVGACPMTTDDQTRVSIELAGAGALVLPSVFEEQVIRWTQKIGRPITEREHFLVKHGERVRTNPTCKDADSYLELVGRSSSQLSIPVIASVAGYMASGWLDFAGKLQEAGAAGIELNVHRNPMNTNQSSSEIEDAIVGVIEAISRAVSIPLFIKLERDNVSVPHFARRACSGTGGLVLYGRGPDTDICLDSLKLKSAWQLTLPGSALQLIEPIMRVHGSCPAISIAASGGITTSEDVIKVLLAGADVAMVTSELYRSGPDAIRRLLDGLTVFLEQHHLRSLRELQMQRPLEFASDEERVNYIAALSARLDRDKIQFPDNSALGDRWGHPTTIR